MKQIITLTVILTFLFSSAGYTYAFRCGDGKRNLASEGQHKYQILKDCGPPVSKEIVGVDKNSGVYRIVEEWLYIINERGSKQMYLITTATLEHLTL
ncbi:DUF2845 domain-containing protein [Desulfobacter curvatus]|uniref:DUF2845 domain-containing protein n=1 Tax=Desulfobacter curvatus TaxID=2290 RepID=UPI00036659FA